MPQSALAYINGLWDRVTSVSDKAAIKVLVAIIIGWLLFRDSGQVDEKINTIKNLREDLAIEKADHKATKLELLNCRTESNNFWKEVAIGKDSIIAALSKEKQKQ